MNPKLNLILLVDDDIPTNALHKIVIKDSGIANSVHAENSAEAALKYLKDIESHPRPDVIFLDINMPGMNGFEFMKAYDTLDEKCKGRAIIFMLTTSLNPDDQVRAEGFSSVTGFRNKPLDEETLQEVAEQVVAL